MRASKRLACRFNRKKDLSKAGDHPNLFKEIKTSRLSSKVDGDMLL